MPGNAFIRFTGGSASETLEGESLQASHPASAGWLEIGDWSWDVESDTNFTKGTGSAVGKAAPGVLSFSHTYDKSSPVLMTYIVMGTHFATVQIDMLKQTGDASGKPQVYFRLMGKNAFVTKLSSKGGEDGAVTQDVEMVFKEVALGYKMQDNDGKLASTAVEFKWNIAQMNFSTHGDIALNNLALK